MHSESRENDQSDIAEDLPLHPSGLSRFWQELVRRNVVRVASVYVVVSWLIIQVADSTFEHFGIPSWMFRFVVIMLVLGLPAAVLLAWALEWTPSGIKRAPPLGSTEDVTPSTPTLKKQRSWVSVAFAAAVPTILFGSLAVVFYLRSDTGAEPKRAETVVAEKALSIAVLPLLNMSDVPANAFFSAGVHEDILTNLSYIEGLKVISRTSVTRFVNSELDIPEIGRSLGVDYIVEGSVRRVNNHVRVTVQLIDALNDDHLWASNYDRELVDIFATQSSIAREISNSIQLAIKPDSVGAQQGMPTRSVKAYDLYLKAKSLERSETPTEGTLRQQWKLLEQAVREDPDFVEAWANLNEVYDQSIELIRREGWFIEAGEDANSAYERLVAKSLRALKKAFALDPDNVETLIARSAGAVGEEHLTGDIYSDNSAVRRRIMDITVEKYPENAMAWYVLGWWYRINAGDVEAAKPVFKKALELDPLHARIVEGSLGFFHDVADQEMVELLYDRIAQISPELGEKKSLGKVSIVRKFFALLDNFYVTADQSNLESMAEILQSEEFGELSPMIRLRLSVEIGQLENDLQRFAQLKQNPLLAQENDPGSEWEGHASGAHLHLLDTLMSQYRKSGDTERAAQLARRILDSIDRLTVPTTYQATVLGLQSRAYQSVGQTEEAVELAEIIIANRSAVFDPWGISALAALALLDPTRAVAKVLQEKDAYPSSLILDVLAVFHLDFREIIIQPELQAYYRKEGKWIDYLAERVPEYANSEIID